MHQKQSSSAKMLIMEYLRGQSFSVAGKLLFTNRLPGQRELREQFRTGRRQAMPSGDAVPLRK